MANLQFFSLDEIVSLSKHLEAHPRQMQLGMRSLQALQVQASPSGFDMSFNYTLFQLTAVGFKIICSMLRTPEKVAKSQITFSSPKRASVEEARFRLSRKTDRSKEHI